jgi:hypothetical protein
MISKEHITHEAGNDEAWICVCGNRPSSGGFQPCDKNGDEISPDKGSNWAGLYVCDGCGRIIDQNTLEVVGRNENHKRLIDAQ